MQLIECVPNFSEGRDSAIIDAITSQIAGTPGARLLDVDRGEATNRTVVTFVGPPGAVEEAAFRSIATAAELIDMREHLGEHPRMGATDVCPFVPMEGATMGDCVEIARRLGGRVGDLGIPVYLYEHAAPDGRRSLAEVRSGEYEGLAERTAAPDYGPAQFNARSGATAIGARQFLVAYNVNLNTRDRRRAHAVAQAIRELGTPRRDEDGKILKDDDGKTVFDPGRFKECKAVGWYIEEYDRAQVSINLTDHHVTSIHDVFDACREEAAMRGMRVTGSEIVGLVPREAILSAGDHYLEAQGATTGVPEQSRIRSAVLSLGLDDLAPFDAMAKVVEYRYRGAPGGLRALTLDSFADELSSDSAAPGGGSVAALVGGLSAALTSMLAAITHAKKGMEDVRPTMLVLGKRAQELKEWFLDAVDRDADAFNEVLTAIRLPRKTDEERAAREVAMAEANRRATVVPVEILEQSVRALEISLIAARDGNPNTISDAAVGGVTALAAAEGASLNVRINLQGLEGDISDLETRHDEALARARELAAQVAAVAEEVLTT